MSDRLFGADIEALRRLADTIAGGGETLDTAALAVEQAMPDPDLWEGPDGEGFRQEWSSSYSPTLRTTAAALREVATKVRENADDQEMTSGDYDGVGAGLYGGARATGSSGTQDTNFFDVFDPGRALVEFGGAAWKSFKYGRNLLNYTRALDGVGDAAASASVFARQFMLEDGLGIMGKLGTFGKFAGVAGGAFGVIGGIDQMINPRYDGWRGGLDRAMGGVAAVGGVATVGMFLGAAAFTGPVGIGIAVGAGLVVGAYELTNLVVDNWDAITGFVADPMPYLADGLDQVTDFASDAVDTAGEVVSDVGDAIGDGAEAVGDFVGGLFS